MFSCHIRVTPTSRKLSGISAGRPLALRFRLTRVFLRTNKKTCPKEQVFLFGGGGGIRTLAGAFAPLTI